MVRAHSVLAQKEEADHPQLILITIIIVIRPLVLLNTTSWYVASVAWDLGSD